MRKTLNKIIAGAVALCMVASMGAANVFAAAPYTDGDYTAHVTFMHETNEKPSMCNPLFDKDADVVVKGDTAELTVYAANPVPAFADQGKDGTVKNVVMTLDGVQYTAVSDMESKTQRKFEETNPLFGIKAGDMLPTQALTFTVPTAKLDMLAAGVPTGAFVNVVMMTDVVFRLKVENITKVGGETQPEPVKPTETREHSMAVSADIAAPVPSYKVKIPESIAMGTLTSKEDNVAAYTVDVTAENLGEGYVEVTSPERCTLSFEDNAITVTNTFGTQKTSQTASLAGEFRVSAEIVDKAVAGNYTGTANFTISYYAAK